MVIAIILHNLKSRQLKQIKINRTIMREDTPEIIFENYGYELDSRYSEGFGAELSIFDFRIKRYSQSKRSLLEKKLDIILK